MYIFNPVLEPWIRLATSAPGVISLRMSLMPWLWATNPEKAQQELNRMVSEKEDAWNETLLVMAQAPAQLWVDCFAACFAPTPFDDMAQAMVNASRRAAAPSNRRVRANQRRLSSGKRP